MMPVAQGHDDVIQLDDLGGPLQSHVLRGSQKSSFGLSKVWIRSLENANAERANVYDMHFQFAGKCRC